MLDTQVSNSTNNPNNKDSKTMILASNNTFTPKIYHGIIVAVNYLGIHNHSAKNILDAHFNDKDNLSQGGVNGSRERSISDKNSKGNDNSSGDISDKQNITGNNEINNNHTSTINNPNIPINPLTSSQDISSHQSSFNLSSTPLDNNTNNPSTLSKHFFKLTLTSPLYRLSLNKANRIYTNKSIVEIIKRTLDFYRGYINKEIIFSSLYNTYPKEELITQYNESDLDFLMRLAHNNGIYFYEDSNHIYFCDGEYYRDTSKGAKGDFSSKGDSHYNQDSSVLTSHNNPPHSTHSSINQSNNPSKSFGDTHTNQDSNHSSYLRDSHLSDSSNRDSHNIALRESNDINNPPHSQTIKSILFNPNIANNVLNTPCIYALSKPQRLHTQSFTYSSSHASYPHTIHRGTLHRHVSMIEQSRGDSQRESLFNNNPYANNPD
ncbi:hypothetical protein CQA53_10980, partial [Helicobacter didelphidarum]